MAEIGSNVAAFLGKLWRMVEDPETNDLICWSENGQSFLIRNQSKFAKELLPRYYKHNNMASFIRQLNMYGFHKIVSPDAGGLKTSTNDEVEFSHTYFVQGHPYMLEHIKRKITKDQNLRESNLSRTDVVNKIIYDVKHMKGRQESFDSKLCSMKQENEALWRELSILRQKHHKQQQIVNKLINFLVSLVQPARNGLSVQKINLPMIKGRREHTDSFCSDDSNFDSGGLMGSDKVQLMTSGDEQDNSPPGATIYEVESPGLLEDIDILQGTDTMLTSPLSAVDQIPMPSPVDVNLLSSNTENNPLLLDLVKDVISEEETLVSVPPQQILPVNIKRKNPNNSTVTTSTQNQTKRTRSKKTAATTSSADSVAVGRGLTNTYTGVSGNTKTEAGKVSCQNGEGGQDQFINFPITSSSSNIFPVDCTDTSRGSFNADESLLPMMDVNLIKEENDSPSGNQDGVEDDDSSPAELNFGSMNCFAETPAPGELDLHGNLSSCSTSSQCVPMYKTPAVNRNPTNGRSSIESYFRTPEQLDTHVGSIQNDLDSLKDIMRGEGLSLDASTILNLFEATDNFKVENSNSFSGSCAGAGNELTTYAPSIDFSDMFSGSNPTSGASSPSPWSEVNTPLCLLNSDDSPSPTKRRKK